MHNLSPVSESGVRLSVAEAQMIARIMRSFAPESPEANLAINLLVGRAKEAVEKRNSFIAKESGSTSWAG